MPVTPPITIPIKIEQLVVIARKGEFPSSVWASEIVAEWLWDHTQAVGDNDPEKSPVALDICQRLGIDYSTFVNNGGELYRREAQLMLARALGIKPDREAFLKVSALVMAHDIRNEDQRGVELDWEELVPGWQSRSQHSSIIGGDLPVPVWQCLMRYFSDSWSDPASAWHHATQEYAQAHPNELGYNADQLVPIG